MIGRLYGKLLEKTPPYLLIEVAGVGYELLSSVTTCFALPEVGKWITLYTHLIVREDHFQLYGFSNTSEKKLFQTLIRINGVGPKSALAILSSIESDKLVQAVLQEDMSALLQLPGIGKKTAQRLIMELQDKLRNWIPHNLQEQSLSGKILVASKVSIKEEAISALMALGYKSNEAAKAIHKVSEECSSCEALLRQALQQSVKRVS